MQPAPGGCSTASRRAFLRSERCVFQDGADNAASPTIHGDIGDRGVSPEPRGRDGRVERLRGGACRVQKPSSRGLDRVCKHLHLASSGDASSQSPRVAVAGRRTSDVVSRACIQAASDPSGRIILTSLHLPLVRSSLSFLVLVPGHERGGEWSDGHETEVQRKHAVFWLGEPEADHLTQPQFSILMADSCGWFGSAPVSVIRRPRVRRPVPGQELADATIPSSQLVDLAAVQLIRQDGYLLLQDHLPKLCGNGLLDLIGKARQLLAESVGRWVRRLSGACCWGRGRCRGGLSRPMSGRPSGRALPTGFSLPPPGDQRRWYSPEAEPASSRRKRDRVPRSGVAAAG